ncbi:MAG TPA: bifunctional methylenetetrahydrofolate dehydrogenase/methenyltetrahydrofolate cyclohydrolase, partial [Candidatus Competibacter phosphatis]|nr:bifunctional methylenetetrahydrofolate dehydrogenase/methenyltetrahydrofolate cyclohydrolase [Candidatus Competibacter phosphatis]
MVMATIIDGKGFAARLRANIAACVTRLKADHDLTP